MYVQCFQVLNVHLLFFIFVCKAERSVPAIITRCFNTGIFSLSPGSTSKAGGVHFPDDDEPPGSPTRRDDQSNLSTLIAILEKDGSYLVKVRLCVCTWNQRGCLMISHMLTPICIWISLTCTRYLPNDRWVASSGMEHCEYSQQISQQSDHYVFKSIGVESGKKLMNKHW